MLATDPKGSPRLRYIFLDVEASKVMVLEEKVKVNVTQLLHHIKSNLAAQRVPIFMIPPSYTSDLTAWLSNRSL